MCAWMRTCPFEFWLFANQVAKFAKSVGVPVLLDVGGKDTPLDPELAPLLTICWPNETELMNITGGMPTGSEQEVAAAVGALRDQASTHTLAFIDALLDGVR